MRRWIRDLSAFLTVVFTVLPLASAQDRVVVVRLDGEPLSGSLIGITEAGDVELSVGSKTEVIPRSATVAINFAATQLPPQATAAAVDLVSGDRIFAVIEDGNFDEVKLGTSGAGSVKLLLDHVAEVHFRSPKRKLQSLPGERGQDDELYFLGATGRLDRLPGEVLKLDRSGVSFASDAGKERVFSPTADRLVALRFAKGEPLPKLGPGIDCIARFRDGGRLTGQLLPTKDRGLQLKLRVGPTASLDPHGLLALEFQSSSFAWLSALEPKEVVQVPYLEGDVLIGFGRDGNAVADQPLRIGERTFRRGLALVARSTVTYELDGRYTRFLASVGTDPKTRARSIPGSTRLSAMADGREVWKSELLLAGEPPRSVDIKLPAGTKRFTVIADFGESFQTGAVAILGDAMLRADR